MTTYATGNPVPSVDVRDLYDNAQNLDTAVNDRTSRTWIDRLGVPRKSWFGIEQDFQDFLMASGYVDIGNYGAGLTITSRNQIFVRDGQYYRASAGLELPYTTTGIWANESALFVGIGDALLRQELALATGSSLVGTQQSGVGSVFRSLVAKINETISVTDFGADPTGVADSRAAILAAADYVSTLGGGRLHYPPGRYRILAPLVFGDGSNTSGSTKHHNIIHCGSGVGTGLDTTMSRGATEIFYDGSAGAGVVAVDFAGPLHSIKFQDIYVDCNNKAGIGVNVNHVTDSVFDNVSVIRATAAGWKLITRNQVPAGTAYGCSNNMFINCNNFFPGSDDCWGIYITTGQAPGPIIVDPANNDFIGGEYFYGHLATCGGVYLGGTDNNVFNGCQFIPNAATSFAYSVYFDQWDGDDHFPMENVFINIGSSDPVGGTSGTFGNTFTIMQEGDGTPIPQLPYVNVNTHTGKEIVQGKRAYRTRQIKQEQLVGINRDTTSASFVAVPGLTASITDVKADAVLRVTCTARVGKLTGGRGDFIIYINGVAQLATKTSVPVNTEYQNTALTITLPVAFAGDFAAGLYFSSSDGNITRVSDGVIILEELF